MHSSGRTFFVLVFLFGAMIAASGCLLRPGRRGFEEQHNPGGGNGARNRCATALRSRLARRACASPLCGTTSCACASPRRRIPGGFFVGGSSWAAREVRRRATAVGAQDAAFVGFRTAALDVRVERNPLRLVIRDLAGNVISADAVGRPTEFRVGGFSIHKAMPSDEHYFGLGDKAGTFDRRNQAYTLWNTDIGTQESIDPIYKSIPFFLAIGGGRSYGLFLDNTWRTWFDFGKQSRDSYSFGAEGGPLDYYMICGSTPKQVVEGYAYLTGTHPLPPLWTLGFQQSRYSYTPESQIREIADRLRADKIPSRRALSRH